MTVIAFCYSDMHCNHLHSFSTGSSVQFNSEESMTHFLQFHEVVVVRKEEFLPCAVMEKYWSFYKGCEDFGF